MSTKKKERTLSLDQDGSEIVDSRPMEIPVGFRRPPSLQEQIQRFVRVEMSERAHARGEETFEESEYFGEEDRIDASSPYELEFDPSTGHEVTKEELRHIRAGEREFDKNYKAYREALAKEKAEEAAYRKKRRADYARRRKKMAAR